MPRSWIIVPVVLCLFILIRRTVYYLLFVWTFFHFLFTSVHYVIVISFIRWYSNRHVKLFVLYFILAWARVAITRRLLLVRVIILRVAKVRWRIFINIFRVFCVYVCARARSKLLCYIGKSSCWPVCTQTKLWAFFLFSIIIIFYIVSPKML